MIYVWCTHHQGSHAYPVILTLFVEVLQKCNAIRGDERSSFGLACCVNESLHGNLLVNYIFGGTQGNHCIHHP